MEALKETKKEAFVAIGYHPTSDDFYDPVNAFGTRYQYYRSGSQSIPLSIIDGSSQFLGGGSSTASLLLTACNKAATLPPTVDISLSLETPGQIHVEVVNTSTLQMQGTLHIALVERHRPYAWRDMEEVDFICRTMMPGPNGQAITLAPSQNFITNQPFSIQPDWNYCSIVAFFQTGDKIIRQGAMIDIEDSIPSIQMEGGPKTGALWLKGSTHFFSWSTNRPLSSAKLQYSNNGGTTWNDIQTTKTGRNTYSGTLPQENCPRCLLAVRDPIGGAMAASGLFAIGIKGDFNADNKIDVSDRNILIEYLAENKAALLPGMDLNEDGFVDLFDLIYFDANFGK
jgi:hypothetical protein